MRVIKAEQGYDFITLYFSSGKDLRDYSLRLYKVLESRFPYMDIQRENFRHLPGDVPHFHAHEKPQHPHFHILYPHRPNEYDIEFLRIWGNRGPLTLPTDLPIERVS